MHVPVLRGGIAEPAVAFYGRYLPRQRLAGLVVLMFHSMTGVLVNRYQQSLCGQSLLARTTSHQWNFFFRPDASGWQILLRLIPL